MNIFQKFYQWLSKNDMEESWAKQNEKVRLVKVRLEFSNGLTRELTGERAVRWHRAIHETIFGFRNVKWPAKEEWENHWEKNGCQKEKLLKKIAKKIEDERMLSLFELLVEHENEREEDEKKNIRRTVAEILENAPLELPRVKKEVDGQKGVW